MSSLLGGIGKFLPLVGGAALTVASAPVDAAVAIPAALGAGAAFGGTALGNTLGGVSSLNHATSTGNLSPHSVGSPNGSFGVLASDANTAGNGSYVGSGGGGGAATSGPTLQQAQQQVQAQLDAYNANYNQQQQAANTGFADAQTAHDQQAAQLQQYYNQQQGNLDSQKQQSDQQFQNLVGGRGIAGSSWANQQQANANSAYQQQVQALQSDQLGKLQQVDQALQQAKNQLTLNHQNLDISQFQNLSQLQQYMDQFAAANKALDDQAAQVKNAITSSTQQIQSINANPSNSYNSASATQGMVNQINSMIAAGTSKQAIQGYIKQGANKDQLQQLLDYYQNVSNTGNVAPAATAPAAA